MKALNEIQVENISAKNSEELKKLAIEANYGSIRFFIAPDKHISKDSVISELTSFFKARKTGEGFKTIHSVGNK